MDTLTPPAVDAQTPERPARWPVVLAVFIVILAILIGVGASVTLPYYSFSPGPAYEIDDLVTMSSPDPIDGEFYMLTISLSPVSVIEYGLAQFDRSVDIIPREAVRPVGQTDEQYRARNRQSMEESKTNSVFVALNHLGYDVTVTGDGVLVAGLTEGSPVEGILMPDDIIIVIDGTPVTTASELTSLISQRSVGDEVVLDVLRDGEPVSLTATLIQHVTDPDRPMVGFLATTHNWAYTSPIDIEIDTTNVGGPSAGLMYTLTLIDLLSEDDLAAGRVVAGTGTIDLDGNVGPIGGIRQKVVAAEVAGADVMFVPADNWDELEGFDVGIELVRVETYLDALAYMTGEES
ncbi:MAG: PDZ domain-containing protein [Acidimicrobiia bacterium]|nr:PDZ domain-containing protein [Acidimicrobiia bacterium]MDH5505484.1 PDZ domain-containing protein [Acidimicrobiia bacterium]